MAATDRLLKLVGLLQDTPGLDARALAGKYGFSLRTVQRDLEALVQHGFPVRFDHGYRLAAPALLAPVQFTAEEALAVRLGLEGQAEPAARSAAAKVAALTDLAALPAPDPPGPQLPLALRPPADPAAERRLDALHQAVAGRRVARLTEASAGRAARELVVHPYRLVFGRGHWWVVGYAPARGRLITMAVARIRAVALGARRFRERPGTRPDRFLARLGPRPAPHFAATLRLAPGAAPLGGALPPRWLARLEPTADGSARLTLGAPHPEQLVLWIFALGDAAEVLEPAALRAELARRGAALARRHGATAAGC
jgi:predicted DNA-binding transcriptional regulator YafY